MATRRSRRGQPAEFEEDPEIERKFRKDQVRAKVDREAGEALDAIEDLLDEGSDQKERALQALQEVVDEANDALDEGADPDEVEEAASAIDQFSASVLLAASGALVDEDEDQEAQVDDAIQKLSRSAANVTLTTPVLPDTSSDEEQAEAFTSAARSFQPSSESDVGDDFW